MIDLVSILIPAYNHTYFEAALRSALLQTYDRMEVVICDDSTDCKIEEIVNTQPADSPRVRYFRNAVQRGPLYNYVECIQKAEGKYIKFLHDDDVLAVNCVERLVEAINSKTDYRIGIATSRRILIDENSRQIADLFATIPLVSEDSEIKGTDIARFMLFSGQNIVGEPTSALIKKEDISKIHPHLMSFEGVIIPRGMADIALWLNLLRMNNVVYLSEPLSFYRIHRAQRRSDPKVRQSARGTLKQLRKRARLIGLYSDIPALKYRYRPIGTETWKYRYITVNHLRCVLESRIKKKWQ